MQFLTQEGCAGWRVGISSSSQVKLMLLVHGPHFGWKGERKPQLAAML